MIWACAAEDWQGAAATSMARPCALSTAANAASLLLWWCGCSTMFSKLAPTESRDRLDQVSFSHSFLLWLCGAQYFYNTSKNVSFCMPVFHSISKSAAFFIVLPSKIALNIKIQ